MKQRKIKIKHILLALLICFLVTNPYIKGYFIMKNIQHKIKNEQEFTFDEVDYFLNWDTGYNASDYMNDMVKISEESNVPFRKKWINHYNKGLFFYKGKRLVAAIRSPYFELEIKKHPTLSIYPTEKIDIESCIYSFSKDTLFELEHYYSYENISTSIYHVNEVGTTQTNTNRDLRFTIQIIKKMNENKVFTFDNLIWQSVVGYVENWDKIEVHPDSYQLKKETSLYITDYYSNIGTLRYLPREKIQQRNTFPYRTDQIKFDESITEIYPGQQFTWEFIDDIYVIYPYSEN